MATKMLRKDSVEAVFLRKTVRLLKDTETIAGVLIPGGTLMRVEQYAEKKMTLCGELDGRIVRLKNIQPRQVEVVS